MGRDFFEDKSADVIGEILSHESDVCFSDRNSGTCSSVGYALRFAAPLTSRPATSIATLRWEIGTLAVTAQRRRQTRQTPGRPTAQSKGKRYGRQCQLPPAASTATDSHPLITPTLKGGYRPGAEYQHECRCPEST